MPKHAKFMKKILQNKRRLEEHQTVMLYEECSAILLNKLSPKLKNRESFTTPCTIENSYFENALCDLSANINLMAFFVFRTLGLGEPKPTSVPL